MKKSELIDQLAKEYPHLYHRDIEKVVDVFYNSISEALANGQRVELERIWRILDKRKRSTDRKKSKKR